MKDILSKGYYHHSYFRLNVLKAVGFCNTRTKVKRSGIVTAMREMCATIKKMYNEKNMFNSQSIIRLIMLLGIMIGAFLLYFLYLIVFTPNGYVGV